MSLDVGSVYEATLACADGTGAPVNPTSAVLTITRPDQTVAVTGQAGVPAVTLPPATLGLVTYDWILDQEGLTKFAWAASGPGGAPLVKTNYVNATGYLSAVSLEATKAHLAYTATDKDEIIRTLMSAATRHAEKIVGTLVPRTFTNDWIPGAYRPVIRLPHGPALTSTSVSSVASVYGNGPAWSASDLVVNPYPGTVYLKSLIDFWYGPWQATYVGGRAVIHDDIQIGVMEVVRDLFAPFRGLSVDVAEQMTDQLSIAPFYRAPARAEMLLQAHAMPGFA